MPAVVYDPRYNIGFWGSDRLHPFDTRKYGRAWQELQRQCGPELRRAHVKVDRAITDAELQLVHSPDYLTSIRRPSEIAKAVEVPLLRKFPGWILDRYLLQPMKWATRGTVLACEAAFTAGVAFNLGGGFHHAKRDRGEGFCLFSDIPLAVRQLRDKGLLQPEQRVAYVDLDAHQGNGVCHLFAEDPDVFIYDQYNADIYPSYDREARERIDCDVPLDFSCPGAEYLEQLRGRLPGFLDSISRTQPIQLAIYNAGTDVLTGDPLGGLSLTAEDILARDHFTIDQLRERNIPVAMLTSGGYTAESYRLIAATVASFLQSS
jgi:histone deacetylase 11